MNALGLLLMIAGGMIIYWTLEGARGGNKGSGR